MPREIDFKEPYVATPGYIYGGTDASIILEFVDFTVDNRSFDKNTRKRYQGSQVYH